MLSCQPKSCYRFPAIPDCLTTLRIKTTHVSADEDDLVVIRIKAPNGKVYVLRKVSDEDGIVTIYLRAFTDEDDVVHAAELPLNLFNPWAKIFTLTVDNFQYQDCEGNNYPCMAFKVADTLDSETDHLLDFTVCGEPYGEYATQDYSGEYNI